MFDRLEHFDDVFTEILIGLALALLIAIGFAPQLLGMDLQPSRFNTSLESCSQLDEWTFPDGLRQVFKEKKILLSDRIVVAVETRNSRWRLVDEGSGQTYTLKREGNQLNIYLEPGIVGWWQRGEYSTFLLWILLVLFCIKLVHEQSVMRYHLQCISPHSRLETILPKPGGRSNFAMFVSRVFLLLSLYTVVILAFAKGGVNELIIVGFIVLLLASYTVPNYIMYRRLSGAIEDRNPDGSLVWLKGVTSVWIVLDFINSMLMLFLIMTFFNPISAGLAVIFLSLIYLPLLIKEVRTLMNQPSLPLGLISKPRTLSFFLLFFLLIIFVVSTLLRNLNVSISQAWIFNFLLFINALDWGVNKSFFFGDPPEKQTTT